MERIEELTYRAQQRQRQGRTLEAIRLFEQALEYRISLHGPDSSSVKKACDNLSDILNGAALKHLQMEEYEEAKKLLQKAEMLTGPDDLISAVTYNNIACYYRRKNKLRTALKYLEKAQRIEMKSRVVANPAGTRLNLCAVLSQLERHNEAREHAQAAVVLLQEELSQMDLSSDDDWENNPDRLNKMAVLAISYHNIGVEEEYLKRHAASLAAYKKGVQIAREYLGKDNDITRTLVKSCQAAQEYLDASRNKDTYTSPGIMRQGEKMGGAYDALQQHNDVKRRAQSAGTQRSQYATPSWATDGNRSLLRPSTAHAGAGNKSLSITRTRAWVDDSKSNSLLGLSAASEKGPMKSDTRDRQRHAYDRDDHPHDYKGHGYSGDYKESGQRARFGNGQPGPTGSLRMEQHKDNQSGSSMAAMNYHSSELEPLSTSLGAKRGPKTPRVEDGEQKVPAIRRPPSASLRQPVCPKLSNGVERETRTQFKLAEEEIPERKSYGWEESNVSGIEDKYENFSDEEFLEISMGRTDGATRSVGCRTTTGLRSEHASNFEVSNPRVAYDRRDIQASTSNSQPRDSTASRAAEDRHGSSFDSGDGGVAGKGTVTGVGRGGGHSIQELENDFFDDDEDGVVDIDSGTEDFIQSHKMSTGHVRAGTRPASTSLCRPHERGLSRDALPPRNLGRPTSASIASIQERRQQEKVLRPASAAPARTGLPIAARTEQDSCPSAVGRAASDSKPVVGRALDYPSSGQADRASLRPASGAVVRPASASITRAGASRPPSSTVHARPASASIIRPASRDARQNDVVGVTAGNFHREEIDILDILSDNSDYESDIGIKTEAVTMGKSNRRAERPQDIQRPAKTHNQDLENKRAGLLAKIELGLGHSDYESDDGAQGGVAGIDNRKNERSAPREDSADRQHQAFEQTNNRMYHRQEVDRQIVGEQAASKERPKRPSDSKSKRPPSRASRPESQTSQTMSQRPKDLLDQMDCESNYAGANCRPLLDDMSGTLKWPEDGLTARSD